MEKSKKRILLLSGIAIVLAGGLMMSDGMKMPTSATNTGGAKAMDADASSHATPMAKEDGKNTSMKSSGIVFYTQDGCIYCKHAMDYITKYYPDLQFEVVNIRTSLGYRKLLADAKKRGIKDVGTPFIILGNSDYTIGWSKENEMKFDNYAADYADKK